MAVTLTEALARLPEAERAAIEDRTKELREEVETLRQLRVARKQSQVEIAERLGVKQAAVSKLERRTDMYISTLRDLIRAMGGELQVVATFPNQPPVHINHFRKMEARAVR